MPVPLLIISDAPTSPTGLGRITRDLALRIHENMANVFRVATFGVGGPYSRDLPFDQYAMQVNQNMVAPELPKVWKDFAGEEKGVVLTIWNPSWLWWMADPEKLPDGSLKDFLRLKLFQKWAYLPIDGDTVDGRLPQSLGDIMRGFDRLLAYTGYGAEVVDATILPDVKTPHLPHGIDTDVFYSRPALEARESFVRRIVGVKGATPMKPEVFLIGVVATNSPRKDWYLAFEVCAELRRRGKNIGLWVHTNGLKTSWDLPMLAEEFGMRNRVVFTNHELSDEEMAWGYSACDVTLGIGSGEGWGFPIAESLACEIPVIHGDYAGAAEFVPKHGLVNPIGYRGDGLYGIRRPVYRASDWADKIEGVFEKQSRLPKYIEWKNAWPEWDQWLKEGLV